MPAHDSGSAEGEVRLARLTWVEVERRMLDGWDTAVLPLGATEQHGPHLPLGTDSLVGEAVALRVARRLGRAFALPVLPVGASEEHRSFPGTVSVSHEAVAALVAEACTGLLERGLRTVVVFSAHGGNRRGLELAAERLAGEPPEGGHAASVVLADLEHEFSPRDLLAERGIDPARGGAHAGLAETSELLVAAPDTVDLGAAAAGWIGRLEAAWPVLTTEGVRALSPNGVLGDPAGASAELGEACLEAWAATIVEAVRRRRG
jgi:mycofactocin system creatininase family protein